MAVKKFLDLEFWAENGIIYLSNEKAAAGKDFSSLSDEEKLKIFKGLPPKVFIRRAIEMGRAFIRYIEEGGIVHDLTEKEIYNFLRDAQEVFEEAKRQGAVDDPKVDEYKLKHKVYRKTQIILPYLTKEDFKKILTED